MNANAKQILVEAGLYFSQMIIWDKQHPVMTRKDYMGAHEWCFYCWKEGAAHRFFGPANETDLWHVKKVTPQKMIHLTEKPVELAVRAIKNSSLQGENVLDLFGGSGTTCAVAVKTGRRFLGIDVRESQVSLSTRRVGLFAASGGGEENPISDQISP